jgi:hypothetical protein
MNEQQLDAQGEAHEALGAVVNDYGRQVLSDPRMLGNLVTDLLPDLPRERSLLVTAAESGVAGELTRHVQEQRLDPDTAVQLVARSLTDRRSIDPAASTWVATEYAQALGYRAPSAARPTSIPTAVAAAAPVMTAVAPDANPQTAPSQPYPPAPAGPAGGYPAGPAGGYPAGPAGGYPAGIPPQGPPSWPAHPPARKRRNLAPILAAGGTALVVGIYFAVAAVVGIAPFAKHTPKPGPTHPTTAPPTTHRTTPTTTPASPVLAPGVAPLTALLPADVDDPATQCHAAPAAGWTNPGLVQALQCSDPGLPGGDVYAYQLNSFANYQTAWANFNSWWPFDASTAGSSCPPSSSGGQGTTTWNSKNNFYPPHQGQVLECQTVGTSGSNEPSYAWTFPTEDAFVIVQAAPGTTFSALDSWWTNNAVPLTSPSPAPSS